MRNRVVLFFLGLALTAPLPGQNHSLGDLFPGLGEDQRDLVFSSTGLILNAAAPSDLRLVPSPKIGVDISGPVVNRDFSCLVEALLVIPYKSKPIELLDIYNALGKIRNLKGRLYHSATRDANIPLFEDASRIKSAKSSASAIPDPPDAPAVPRSETIYLRVKDVNFGNSYYRAGITTTPAGLLYDLSNFKSLTYLFVPVIKEENFVTQMYFEPIAEGVLVYSLAGADVSDFIASRIDIPSAIRKRLEVILDWVIDGIKVFE
jgi:hypothetical protein